MNDIRFEIVEPGDNRALQIIANWYLSEWKIPGEKTIQKIKSFAEDRSQFQVLLSLGDIPVTTGGLYHHVGLLDKEPGFRKYKYWLALVYTVPDRRKHGLGALICNYIQDHAKKTGVKEMHLYTDTAEQLYTRLGWKPLQRLIAGKRKIVVMNKIL